jgi:hypothetical protein
MDEFEFLAVFISIAIGLGVTHILYGLARQIHNRSGSLAHLSYSLLLISHKLQRVTNCLNRKYIFRLSFTTRRWPQLVFR